MLSNEQVQTAVAVGYERRFIEFKPAGPPTEKPLLAVVARAALALSNQRDGGYVIIGVDDADPAGSSTGLRPDDVTAWLRFDTTTDRINKYADPPLKLQVAERQLTGGQSVVVIEVAEFDSIPTICKKDYPNVLTYGSMYTRSMAKPESSSAITQNELRELLDIATEKRLRAFVTTAQNAGVDIGLPPKREATQMYKSEASEWGPRSTRISNGPLCRVELRPVTYDPDRIAFADMRATLGSAQVKFSVPFPTVEGIDTGDNWIGGRVEAPYRVGESWLLYQSGQFLQCESIRDDWQPDWTQEPADGNLPVWLPVQYFTRALTFASRLQAEIAPSEAFQITLVLENILNWRLIAANPRRAPFTGSYVYSSASWTRTFTVGPGELLTDVRSLAVHYARELLARFGWDGATEEMVRGMQEELFGPAA